MGEISIGTLRVFHHSPVTIIQEEIDALERELREKIEQHKNDKVVEELTKYEEHTLRRMKKEILNEIVSYSVDNSANTI